MSASIQNPTQKNRSRLFHLIIMFNHLSIQVHVNILIDTNVKYSRFDLIDLTDSLKLNVSNYLWVYLTLSWVRGGGIILLPLLVFP